MQLRLNARKAGSDGELRKRTVTALRSPPVQTIRVPTNSLHGTDHPQVCLKRQRNLAQRKTADLVPLALSEHVQPGVTRVVSIARNAERYDHARDSLSASITNAMTNPGVIFFLSLGYSGFVMLELFPPFPVGKTCAVIFGLAWIG